jgi:hypothetical protein
MSTLTKSFRFGSAVPSSFAPQGEVNDDKDKEEKGKGTRGCSD